MANVITEGDKALSILERRVQNEVMTRSQVEQRKVIPTAELRRCVWGVQRMQQQSGNARPAVQAKGNGSSLMGAFKRLNADRQRQCS